jgi:hypothetical protein
VLAASASRQKEFARAIAGELKEQDVILEDLEDEVDDAEQVVGRKGVLGLSVEGMCGVVLQRGLRC